MPLLHEQTAQLHLQQGQGRVAGTHGLPQRRLRQEQHDLTEPEPLSDKKGQTDREGREPDLGLGEQPGGRVEIGQCGQVHTEVGVRGAQPIEIQLLAGVEQQPGLRQTDRQTDRQWSIVSMRGKERGSPDLVQTALSELAAHEQRGQSGRQGADPQGRHGRLSRQQTPQRASGCLEPAQLVLACRQLVGGMSDLMQDLDGGQGASLAPVARGEGGGQGLTEQTELKGARSFSEQSSRI